MQRTEIALARLGQQGLVGPQPGPIDVVRHLVAMQAQEYAVAKWSIGQRTVDVDDDAVEALCTTGVLLRTHVLRPTWHFVLAEDIRWLLALSAPRVHAANACIYRQQSLDPDLRSRACSVIAAALAEGAHLTRVELQAALTAKRIDVSGLALTYIVMHAELEGVICSGARRGRQHTYALVDVRAPNPRRMSTDEALTQLVVRYFTSRGPATIRDFSRWSGLTIAQTKRGIAAAGGALATEQIEGLTYYFRDPPPVARLSPTVLLIQAYDEIVMSYSESRDVLSAPDDRSPALPIAEPLLHGILLDGQVVARWRHDRKQRRRLETAFYRRLTSTQLKALDAEIARYSRFCGESFETDQPGFR